MPRMFIGAWPPAAVLDTLEALPRGDDPAVRWSTREQWHVTLRYLGEVEREQAVEGLARIVASPATATLGPSVEMLGEEVVMAPVAGLDELAAAVRDATVDIGAPADPRPFVGHLTLGRLRSGATSPLVGTAVVDRFAVRELVLAESDIRPQGVRYKILDTWSLGCPPTS